MAWDLQKISLLHPSIFGPGAGKDLPADDPEVA
jgi:hypothetical protein